jgi:ribosomal protein S6
MESEVEPKIYEFAYHLTPDLDEADVKTQVQEIFDLISRNQGSVLSSREPERVHLSYPIRHKQFGYFGSFDFAAPREAIEKINAQAKLQNNILRFLLIKKSFSKSGLRILGEQRMERARQKTQELPRQVGKTQATAEKEKETGEKIKTEEIEKEIEKVIKGL